MTMEKISEAILDKIKAEAADIVNDAELKAVERTTKAREQYNNRLQEEKNRLLGAANSEASRIMAQASISIRLELLKVKNEIIDDVVSKIKTKLAANPDNARIAVSLIKEGIEATGAASVEVLVSSHDIDKIKDLIKKDKELSARIKDIRTTNCIGGAIVEDESTGINIDNTYETRLETLLPKVLPEISKELFGS